MDNQQQQHQQGQRQQRQQQQQQANQHGHEQTDQEGEERQEELPLQPWPGNSRPLNRPRLSPEHQCRVDAFWRSQMQEILATTDYRKASLPLPVSRVRCQMKKEMNMSNVSFEATLLTTKACELFIGDLIHRAWLVTENAHRLVVRNTDISSGVERADMYDFLVDILPWTEPRPFRNLIALDNETVENGASSQNNLNNLTIYGNNNLGGGFGSGAPQYYNNWGAMASTNGIGAGVYAPNRKNYWGIRTNTGINISNYNNSNWGEGSSSSISTNTPNYNNINLGVGTNTNTNTGFNVQNYNNNNWGEGSNTGFGTTNLGAMNNLGSMAPPNYNNNSNNWEATMNNLGSIAAPNYFPGSQAPADQNREIGFQNWPSLSCLNQYKTVENDTSNNQVENNNGTMNEFLSNTGVGGAGVMNYFPDSVPVQNNNVDNVGMSWGGMTNWGLSEIFNVGTSGNSVDNPVVVQDPVEEQPVRAPSGNQKGKSKKC